MIDKVIKGLKKDKSGTSSEGGFGLPSVGEKAEGHLNQAVKIREIAEFYLKQ